MTNEPNSPNPHAQPPQPPEPPAPPTPEATAQAEAEKALNDLLTMIARLAARHHLKLHRQRLKEAAEAAQASAE